MKNRVVEPRVIETSDIILEKNGTFVYVLSRTEFEREYGQSINQYNAQQIKEGGEYRALVRTYLTNFTRFGF